MNDAGESDWDEFSSEHNLGLRPIQSFLKVLQELKRHYWQTAIIFRLGFVATFRQTLFGVVWGFVMPLVPLLAFFLLTALRVFPEPADISPANYMAVGVTLWLYLQGLMTAPMTAIDEHSVVVKSTGFPVICLFASSFGRYSFEMLVRLVVVVPVLISLTDLSLTGVGMAIVLLLPATAFGIAIGVLVGLVGIVLRDVKNIADVFFRYMIFLSFALFPLSLEGVGWWWYSFNPFAIFIDNIRSVLLLEQFASPVHFLVLSFLSAVLLVYVLHLYYVLERRIAGAL